MLLTVAIPVAKGTQAIADGTLARVMQELQTTLHPEASYAGLSPTHGRRGGFFVFDLADPAQIPVICEPLFRELEAEVEITPVMTMEDLGRGLGMAAGQQ